MFRKKLNEKKPDYVEDEYYYDYYYEDYYEDEEEELSTESSENKEMPVIKDEVAEVAEPIEEANEVEEAAVDTPEASVEAVTETVETLEEVAEVEVAPETKEETADIEDLKVELNIAEKKLEYFQQTENTNIFLAEQNKALQLQIDELEAKVGASVALDDSADVISGNVDSDEAFEIVQNNLKAAKSEIKELQEKLMHAEIQALEDAAQVNADGFTKADVGEIITAAKKTAKEMIATAEQEVMIFEEKHQAIVEKVKQVRENLLKQRTEVEVFLNEVTEEQEVAEENQEEATEIEAAIEEA